MFFRIAQSRNSPGFLVFLLREIYSYCTGFVRFVNNRGESPYLPDDIAVKRARKLEHTKGCSDRKFQDMDIIEEAIRESSSFAEFSKF